MNFLSRPADLLALADRVHKAFQELNCDLVSCELLDRRAQTVKSVLKVTSTTAEENLRHGLLIAETVILARAKPLVQLTREFTNAERIVEEILVALEMIDAGICALDAKTAERLIEDRDQLLREAVYADRLNVFARATDLVLDLTEKIEDLSLRKSPQEAAIGRADAQRMAKEFWFMDLDHAQVQNEPPVGSRHSVYFAKAYDDVEVALKQFKLNGDVTEIFTLAESIKQHSRIRHPNIAQVIGGYISDENWDYPEQAFIFIEKVSGGNLLEALEDG